MAKSYEVLKFKTKEEWLKARSIGGSSVSALFDLNPYLSKLDIYCSAVNKKKDGEEIDEKENASTIYGHECEPIIRDLVRINLKDTYEVKNPRNYEMYRRKDKPYMSATIDGTLIEKATNRKGVLEIKTYEFRSNNDLEEKWGNQPPIRYSLQTLHYLAVLNDYDFIKLVAKIRWLDYESGEVKKEEIRYYHYERAENQKTIDDIEAVITDFVENHINKQIPPNISLDIFRE